MGAAIAYKQVVHDIMTILIGIKPSNHSGDNNKTCKTEFTSPDKIGISGTPWTFFGKNETTHSGSLHFHVVNWAGISPYYLESVADIPELCEKVTSALNSMYSASIDRHIHVQDLIRKKAGVVLGLKKNHDAARNTKSMTLNTSAHDPSAQDTSDAKDTLDINGSNKKGTNTNSDSDVDMEEVSHLVSQDTSTELDGYAASSRSTTAATSSLHAATSPSKSSPSSTVHPSPVDISTPGTFADYARTLKSCCADESCNGEDCIDDLIPGPPPLKRKMHLPSDITDAEYTKPTGVSKLKYIGGGNIKLPPRVLELPPDPEEDKASYKSHVALTVCHCGIHTHSFTCKKPPKGWHGCRMCYGKALSNGTRPVELLASLQPDGSTQWMNWILMGVQTRSKSM